MSAVTGETASLETGKSSRGLISEIAGWNPDRRL
jgi:hypothetical protein